MKRSFAVAGLFLLIVVIAAPALAVRTGPLRGDRIGILETPLRASVGVDGAVRRAMPGYLRDELERAGFSTRLLRLTIDEVGGVETDVDFYVELAYETADGGAVAAIGTGGIVGGTTGLGAEVAIVAASVEAEVRIYDAHSLALVDSFTLRSSNVSPAITAVSLGDHHGYLAFEIPYLRNQPFRRATRDIAHQAVTRIAGTARSDGR